MLRDTDTVMSFRIQAAACPRPEVSGHLSQITIVSKTTGTAIHYSIRAAP
jgi:hypothetical protein